MLRMGADQLGEVERGDEVRGVPHRIHLERANIEDGVRDLVGRESIDLIVLGSHGRRGFNQVMLGSVAEEVFRGAPCPVLTLGPRAWMEHRSAREIQRILFATDFSPAARAAEGRALALAAEHDAELVLLHVTPAPASEERRQEAAARLASWATPSGSVRARHVIAAGEPAAVIVTLAQNEGADLVVLGVRGGHPWSGHVGWATAHQVVCEATCPVLTVRG